MFQPLDAFDSVLNEHELPVGARHTSFDEQQIAFHVHLDHLYVLSGDTDAAHVAGHAFALEHSARRGACANGARGAMSVGLSVSLGPAAEAMPLDASGKAAALGGAGHVYDIAGLEYGDIHRLAYLNVVQVRGRQFPEITEFPHLSQVSLFSPVQPALLPEAELHRFIAVLGHGLDLGHHAWACLQHRHRLSRAVFSEDLSHA